MSATVMPSALSPALLHSTQRAQVFLDAVGRLPQAARSVTSSRSASTRWPCGLEFLRPRTRYPVDVGHGDRHAGLRQGAREGEADAASRACEMTPRPARRPPGAARANSAMSLFSSLILHAMLDSAVRDAPRPSDDLSCAVSRRHSGTLPGRSADPGRETSTAASALSRDGKIVDRSGGDSLRVNRRFLTTIALLHAHALGDGATPASLAGPACRRGRSPCLLEHRHPDPP